MLEIRNITLTLDRGGESQTLLDNVGFNVPSGHLLAIVGPSGCGKTTLMKTIAGLKEEDEGEIRWDGRNVAHEGDLHPWGLLAVSGWVTADRWRGLNKRDVRQKEIRHTQQRHAVTVGVCLRRKHRSRERLSPPPWPVKHPVLMPGHRGERRRPATV